MSIPEHYPVALDRTLSIRSPLGFATTENQARELVTSLLDDEVKGLLARKGLTIETQKMDAIPPYLPGYFRYFVRVQQ